MPRLQSGVNDLATLRPELASQLVSPSDATTVTEFSGKHLLWFCENEHPRHEWETTVKHRSRGNGCGACSGKVVIPGWNDLGTVRPDLAKQLVDPRLTTAVTESSNKKLLWFCDEGHPRYEWRAQVCDRSKGIGCAACAGRHVIIGWNDLETVRPDLASQLVDPSKATAVTKSSNKKLLWFCEANHPRHEWETTVAHRSRGSGCGVCAGHGYDPSEPGAFYRFEFIDGGEAFLCYGITNSLDKRLGQYGRKLKLQDVQSLHFEKGSIPQEIEKQFHKVRQESSVPASTCGVVGTLTESFSLSPENWELFTVFEAHWSAAALQAQ